MYTPMISPSTRLLGTPVLGLLLLFVLGLHSAATRCFSVTDIFSRPNCLGGRSNPGLSSVETLREFYLWYPEHGCTYPLYLTDANRTLVCLPTLKSQLAHLNRMFGFNKSIAVTMFDGSRAWFPFYLSMLASVAESRTSNFVVLATTEHMFAHCRLLGILCLSPDRRAKVGGEFESKWGSYEYNSFIVTRLCTQWELLGYGYEVVHLDLDVGFARGAGPFSVWSNAGDIESYCTKDRELNGGSMHVVPTRRSLQKYEAICARALISEGTLRETPIIKSVIEKIDLPSCSNSRISSSTQLKHQVDRREILALHATGKGGSTGKQKLLAEAGKWWALECHISEPTCFKATQNKIKRLAGTLWSPKLVRLYYALIAS